MCIKYYLVIYKFVVVDFSQQMFLFPEKMNKEKRKNNKL